MEQTLEQRKDSLKRIVAFGPESTGKSTLVSSLARAYNTTFAMEYMREYYTQHQVREPFYSIPEDLLPIATGQIALENQAAKSANNLLFCDTNLLQLEVYANYYFGECPAKISEAVKRHSYDLYLLTFIDVPWQKDQLRDRPLAREKLFVIFEQTLQKHKLPYVVLKGDEVSRVRAAQLSIQELVS
jgi:NadR type nicotinamide-nucleotide adenylyltransferase